MVIIRYSVQNIFDSSRSEFLQRKNWKKEVLDNSSIDGCWTDFVILRILNRSYRRIQKSLLASLLFDLNHDLSRCAGHRAGFLGDFPPEKREHFICFKLQIGRLQHWNIYFSIFVPFFEFSRILKSLYL